MLAKYKRVLLFIKQLTGVYTYLFCRLFSALLALQQSGHSKAKKNRLLPKTGRIGCKLWSSYSSSSKHDYWYWALGTGKQFIDFVTVFDTILTSRQTRENLQCLYENLMSNSFRKMTVLKNIWTVNESFTLKDSTE